MSDEQPEGVYQRLDLRYRFLLVLLVLVGIILSGLILHTIFESETPTKEDFREAEENTVSPDSDPTELLFSVIGVVVLSIIASFIVSLPKRIDPRDTDDE